MVNFKTIVIFDVETTGLPQHEHNRTKITELSLVACLKSHCGNGNLPRVINKLTLGINPHKMITPESSKVSGLENELLEEMKPFDDGVVSMMGNFLTRLPQPVCLVAHNGNKFDFPIILKHLLKYNCDFISSIYCADSYVAFKELLTMYKIKKNYSENDNQTTSFESRNSESDETAEPKMMKLNEGTPETKTVPYNMVRNKSERLSKRNSSVCRKLNFDNETNANVVQSKFGGNEFASKPRSNCDITNVQVHKSETPKSYKLKDIYDFLHGDHSYSFHKSEEDCLALLSCIIKCQDRFFNWLSENACLLNTIKPLF